jgi:hypothetical protein
MPKAESFRDDLVWAEYDFQRREFHTVHSPTLLGGTIALNVGVGAFLWNEPERIFRYFRLPDEGGMIWFFVLLFYLYLLAAAFIGGIRSVLIHNRKLETFAVEEEYDKKVADGGEAVAREHVRARIEERTKRLRRLNIARRARHRSANRAIIGSLIAGFLLLAASAWPSTGDRPATVDEFFARYGLPRSDAVPEATN